MGASETRLRWVGRLIIAARQELLRRWCEQSTVVTAKHIEIIGHALPNSQGAHGDELGNENSGEKRGSQEWVLIHGAPFKEYSASGPLDQNECKPPARDKLSVGCLA